ncbi:MAG: methyltransferase domain-containing protein [Proteobacteria bacterium]|nr:methyltransferase domain-containing protein [Pseudomonadota bacterium]
MHAPPLPDSTFAWDQYWHDGRLASCGGEGGANYQPLIAEGWRRFFEAFPEGTRMLDVCSGNGAVARLAAEVAAARHLSMSIDAADAAAIRPPRLGPGAGMIRFSPRTPAESLPFPDDCFDVIVGQYAIEYTNVDRSLAELRRVSRETADIRFVMHAADSTVVQEARRQLDDVDRLTATGIFEAAEALVRASGSGLPPVNDATQANFRHALQALQSAATHAEDLRMYQNVGAVIVHAIEHQPQVGAGPVLDKIIETGSAIRAHQARLSAMRRAALDAAGAQALARSAEQLWSRPFRLAPLIRSDGAKFGWVLASNRDLD